MSPESELSRNTIKHIYVTSDTSSNPVVQICELKRISQANANASAPPRYRLAVSDGVHFQQAMLATQLNSLIDDGKISLFCLVRLNDFICNSLLNKRILIILNLDIVAPPQAKIGNPIGIDAAMSGAAPPQQTIGGHANENARPNAMVDVNPTTGQPKPMGGGSGFGAGANSSWHASAGNGNPYAGTGNSGIMTKISSNPAGIYRPIQSINPYQNGWTIRGRCTYKSDLRKFQNHRGDGQVISFELTDESGSIRVTGFTQHAPIIEQTVHISHIYKVSRGSLKQANEKYNRSTSNFEMTLDKNSVLEEVDDDGSFMQVKYNFTKIAELGNIEVKGECDVVGVVTAIGPLGEIIIRSTGEPCNKRSIHITDDSNSSVELTLWRKQAESFLTETDLDRHPIIVIRKASRGDFGGVCLNVNRSTTMELDPVNVTEANKLRHWYDSGGFNAAAVQSVTSGPGGGGKITGPRKSLEVAKIEDVQPAFTGGSGSTGATATFVTRAYVGFVNTKNDLYYPGDPETKKKLTRSGPDMWSSESSGRTFSDDEVVWRYIMSMKIMDHSSSTWVSGFDEVGMTMFGKSAQEFRALKENDPTLADQIIEDVTFRPMLMKVTVKERVWRDEQQIRYTISRAEPLNFAQEGRVLMNEISSYGVM
ncbi:Replication factor-a protein 1 Rpa1 [Chondrus crispus]|uniref:Replication protein A subunit n=1 Tax=Chondrus crispus TaxID=2769 RepID=R7Q3F5_CHOCR|nr:Replication factor-a protein 1 Rpa1 [Chondrus crispus]CDF32539.1 Replication factor-a protein 1 Rpa1 [Chondrus crispus]|eukprot:XP_005712204.1 Replication factor-a protein 1 Rpa1 [Chondrus crispus]